MQLLHAFFFGIGMLILVYLALNNAKGVTDIIGQTSKSTNDVSTILQGR